MLRILSTNEQRLKTLNSMRASHRGHQLLKQNRVASTPIETTSAERWDNDLVKGEEVDMLKQTAETMYASTGDTIWLAF